MKLYRLGENEIRIHLSKQDLQDFAITLEDFDYDSTRGRRVIWELFDKAKEETGFDAAKERVYIQLYPCEKGGCELFVTKLEDDSEENCDCFLFSDFDTLHEALTHFFTKDWKVYRLGKSDKYYVFLPKNKIPPSLWEFGEPVKLPSAVYLKARCKPVVWGKEAK